MMACPVCDHTMSHAYGLIDEGIRMWWCPRCGTLGDSETPPEQWDSPAITTRCRQLCCDYRHDERIAGLLRVRGITEACTKDESWQDS